MTAAQRHNARQDKIWETAKRLRAEQDAAINALAGHNGFDAAAAIRAYPRLVEALRLELIESDRMMAKGSRDLLDWQDANRVCGDRIRALLRSIGEGS